MSRSDPKAPTSATDPSAVAVMGCPGDSTPGLPSPVNLRPGALATVLGQPVEPMLITSPSLFGSTFRQPLLTNPLGGALLGAQRRRQRRSGRDGCAGIASLPFRLRVLTILPLRGQQIRY